MSKNISGMTVKLTLTINAAGHVATIYITVKGLNMKEMLLREGNEESKAGTNNNDDESACIKNFRHYHDKVYVPFIKNQESVVNRLRYKKKTDEVPDFLAVSGWIDGAVDQLATILSKHILN
eukprot:7748305-Ditylum_brightwellii.AAC.1